MTELWVAADQKTRCSWCSATEQYIKYHDEEWGFPVADDQKLFEKLCLESFQSGLSWRTILEKRDNFREAFAQFDCHQMAKYTERDVERLLQNSGIVRHRGKIEAVINNAKRAQELIVQEGSLARYFWQFEPEPEPVPLLLSKSEASEALSKELKKKGWKFVGPTTVHAFMQAMGLINDHLQGCETRERVQQARLAFQHP